VEFDWGILPTQSNDKAERREGVQMAHVQDYQDRIIRARKDLEALLRDCPHNIDPATISARCTMCGEDFGWHCPQSPDQVCHYYTDRDGQVRLLDGSKVEPPSGHDAECETEDDCIYCGQPEERK